MFIYFEDTGTQSCQETISYLDKNDIPFQIVPFSIYYQEEKLKEIAADPRAVFFGNTKLAYKLKEFGASNLWVGPEFNATSYKDILGSYYLNTNFSLIPAGARGLLDNLVQKDYFIRSDDGDKGFPGTVCSFDEIREVLVENKDIDFILSDVVYIKSEYRVVMFNGLPIAGGLYKTGGKSDLSRNWPGQGYTFARKMSQWLGNYPPFYVMDICEVWESKEKTSFRVVELNSFNSSGLYKIDREPIFKWLGEFVNARN